MHRIWAALAVILFWAVALVVLPIVFIGIFLMMVGAVSGVVFTIVSDTLVERKLKKKKNEMV